jgi:hypothetical protein
MRLFQRFWLKTRNPRNPDKPNPKVIIKPRRDFGSTALPRAQQKKPSGAGPDHISQFFRSF